MHSGDRVLSVVLPAYDEEPNIGAAVAAVTAAADGLAAHGRLAGCEVVVVDDGSRDGTAQVVESLAARDPRVRLVQHQVNRGYGEALRSGFATAAGALVFLTDADLQFDAAELDGFLARLDAPDRPDVVAGYRVERADTPVRRLNALGWNLLVRAVLGVPVRDIDCAFKLFRREVFDVVDLRSVGAMVSTELMVQVGRRGLRVAELAVTHRPRVAGQARGADPRVVATAFVELARMTRRLRAVRPLPARAQA